MGILFRKKAKFQYGGSIDAIDTQVAKDLGVTYAGEHPRSLFQQLKKEFANIHDGYYDADGKLHVTDLKGKDITDQIMRSGSKPSVVAANTPGFAGHAQAVSPLFGGKVVQAPVNFQWNKDFAAYVNRMGEGSGANYKGHVGNLMYQGSRNEPAQTIPLSVADYMKYKSSLPYVLSGMTNLKYYLGE